MFLALNYSIYTKLLLLIVVNIQMRGYMKVVVCSS